MKRIPRIVAVGLLLVTPLVIAQSAPDPLLPPSTTTAQPSSKDIFHDSGFEDGLLEAKGSFRDTGAPNTESSVTGSFNDPTSTNPHSDVESPVTGSFPRMDTGS